MEIELKQQTEKPFFQRQEYVFEVKAEKTLSYGELKVEISKKLNVDASLVMIKRLKHQFGKSAVSVEAYVYGSMDAMKKYEDIKEEKKAESAEEKPAEQAAPAAEAAPAAAEPAKE